MNALKTIVCIATTIFSIAPAFALSIGIATSPVLERLESIAAQLEALRYSSQADKRPLTFKDLADYQSIKPWAQWSHLNAPVQRGSEWSNAKIKQQEVWPTAKEKPILRALLRHSNPSVRALAVDALASLNNLDDIPLIAALLADTAQASEVAPVLERPEVSREHAINNRQNIRLKQYIRANLGADLGRTGAPPRPPSTAASIEHVWSRPTVAHAASLALMALTQASHLNGITAEAFFYWWQRNSDAKQSLWFWRDKVMTDPAARKELRMLNSELEAKVRILLPDGTPFFGASNPLLLGEDRLMALLENPELWREGRWDGISPVLVVQAVTELGSPILHPRNAARIQALLGKPESAHMDYLLHIALSRCQSDPAVRDAMLRRAIAAYSQEKGVNRYRKIEATLQEVVRIGLPAQQDYLTQLFFTDHHLGRESASVESNLYRRSITQGLAAAPPTSTYRNLLTALWLDPRAMQMLDNSNDTDFWTWGLLSVLSKHRGTTEAAANAENDQYRLHLKEPDTAAESRAKLLSQVKELKDSKP